MIQDSCMEWPSPNTDVDTVNELSSYCDDGITRIDNDTIKKFMLINYDSSVWN